MYRDHVHFRDYISEKQEEFIYKTLNHLLKYSYSLIIDIIKRAKRKILIIDNYINDSILKMLSKKNKIDIIKKIK